MLRYSSPLCVCADYAFLFVLFLVEYHVMTDNCLGMSYQCIFIFSLKVLLIKNITCTNSTYKTQVEISSISCQLTFCNLSLSANQYWKYLYIVCRTSVTKSILWIEAIYATHWGTRPFGYFCMKLSLSLCNWFFSTFYQYKLSCKN